MENKNMYWQEELETMSREDLEKLQLARLKKPSKRRPILLFIIRYSRNTASRPTAYSRSTT